jgi:pimeloyl-ACP methyl ester carboxylesterase
MNHPVDPIAVNPADVKDAALVASLPGFDLDQHDLGDVTLNTVSGGDGSALILLPGWPQTCWSFHRLMPELARDHRVIAVDLRGMGASSRPPGGYDKKTMSGDIRRLMVRLGIRSASVVGHDIAAQVAFSLADNHPEVVEKLVLVDIVHVSPEWYTLPLLPGPGTFVDQSKPGPGGSYLGWFAFHQVKDLPEQLLGDRAYREQEWFFNYASLNSRPGLPGRSCCVG